MRTAWIFLQGRKFWPIPYEIRYPSSEVIVWCPPETNSGIPHKLQSQLFFLINTFSNILNEGKNSMLLHCNHVLQISKSWRNLTTNSRTIKITVKVNKLHQIYCHLIFFRRHLKALIIVTTSKQVKGQYKIMETSLAKTF